MKFDALDKKMRQYETWNEATILNGMFLVARIDGRGFTRLTKELLDFEKPFDKRFHALISETVQHLMNCGFNVIYGYTQSDEISLLFHPKEIAFAGKIRKYTSLLAGEASAKFSLLLGQLGVFDCRMIQLPNPSLVIDYFRWRQEDAHRNALSAHCYWLLRSRGLTANEATQQINRLNTAGKNELLFSYNINYNDLPSWQKRGTGFYWKTKNTTGTNPVTGNTQPVERRYIFKDEELPLQDAYSQLLAKFLENI